MFEVFDNDETDENLFDPVASKNLSRETADFLRAGGIDFAPTSDFDGLSGARRRRTRLEGEPRSHRGRHRTVEMNPTTSGKPTNATS
jgi:hypothetical protein